MDVIVSGDPDCQLTASYVEHLSHSGVGHRFTSASEEGAAPATGVTVQVGDTTLDEPTIDELDRWLERYELREREIHHEPAGDGSGRYVLPLLGGDAFITYIDRGDVRNINYSEVPVARRGQGLGAELSQKTLDDLIAHNQRAMFGCGYVAAVASRYEPWQQFNAQQSADRDS